MAVAPFPCATLFGGSIGVALESRRWSEGGDGAYNFREVISWLGLKNTRTSGYFKICFRWSGKKLKNTVKTTGRADAEAVLARFKENLHLLERGPLELPPDADIGTFLLSDGKLKDQPFATQPNHILTLAELRDAYVQVLSNGAMEENSLDTTCMHLRHVIATLGDNGYLPRDLRSLTEFGGSGKATKHAPWTEEMN